MASSNHTTNLHLNAWTDSDRPKRADFVSDNNIIDTQLGGHINNSGIHVTADEKAKLNNPYEVSVYAGSGAAQRTIVLSFVPKFVIVFKRGVPAVSFSNGATVVNSGCAAYGNGNTAGVSINNVGVTIQEIAADSEGVKVSLNAEGSQYTMIAFK